MSPPRIDRPAYLGLYASLVLALTCNTYLDIQYGSFGFETIFWAVVQGWTLLIGWKQATRPGASGLAQQRVVLVLGLALTLLVFMPKWGFPRAGLYLLGFLQAAMNCVLTTRRQLYFGLLVSAVMVMFAASHYRADWTMLFYLVPYVVAAVFTMVSEQVGGRAASLRQVSLGQPGTAGTGIAIAAATGMILATGLGAYLLTPQLSWPYLEWRYGQLSNLGWLREPDQPGRAGQGQGGQGEGGQGGEGEGEGQAGGSDSGAGGEGGAGSPGEQAGSAGAGQGSGPAAEGSRDGSRGVELAPGPGWPSPAEMRQAARRKGMPAWQSQALERLAAGNEALQQAMLPIQEVFQDLWKQLKDWLHAHRALLWRLLLVLGLVLGLVALAVMLGLLLWAYNVTTWLRTRCDYLWLALLGGHRPGVAGARQYYRAMERLFALQDLPRPPHANAREYQQALAAVDAAIHPEIAGLTGLFEHYRYGARPPGPAQLREMREVYRALYEKFA